MAPLRTIQKMSSIEKWIYQTSFMIFGSTRVNRILLFILLTLVFMNVILFIIYEDFWFDADIVTMGIAVSSLISTTIWFIGALCLYVFYLWRLPYVISWYQDDNEFMQYVFKKFELQTQISTKIGIFVFFSQLFVKKTLPALLACFLSLIIYYDYYTVQQKMLDVLHMPKDSTVSPIHAFLRQRDIANILSGLHYKSTKIVFLRDLNVFTTLDVAKKFYIADFQAPKDIALQSPIIVTENDVKEYFRLQRLPYTPRH